VPADAAPSEAGSTDVVETADRPSAPKSRRGLESRVRLVDAAKQVFEEDGFLDARISDITQRAGMSHGSFYYYFDSKEEIFREVAAAVEDELSAPLGDVVLAQASNVPASVRIREALTLHFEAYRAEARIMGVIEQVSRYDDHISAMRQERHRLYNGQIADSIRQLQKRNLADPDLDPVVTAAALGAMTYRFAELWLVQGALDCPFEIAVDQLARVFVNALQLRGPANISMTDPPTDHGSDQP